MNDLETRLRDSLDRHIGGPPHRTLAKETRARVAHARRRVFAGTAVAVVAVLAIAAAGLRALPFPGAEPASGTSWPNVVVGDPKDAFISTAEPGDIVGLRYVLSSGTVNGMPYSLQGWTSRRLDGMDAPAPCLSLAGPADPSAIPQSPGPQPPGAVMATAGVGGYCMPTAPLSEDLGWPKFPSEADLFVRTVGPGGTGVCEHCAPGPESPFAGVGYVSERVASVTLTLENGSTQPVQIRRWPNAWHVGALLYFQPDLVQHGTISAYADSGALLATAPICGDGWTCDVSDVNQIVPVGDVPAPAVVEIPDLPYFAKTGDWPSVEPIADGDRPDQERFASGAASPLIWGSVEGSAFDAYALQSGAGCEDGTTFGVSIGRNPASTDEFCSSPTGVPDAATWYVRSNAELIPNGTVLSGVVTNRYADVRVTLDDGSSQYLRLFRAPDGSELSFFIAFVPRGQGGTVVFDAPDGTGLAEQAFGADSSGGFSGAG